MRFSPYRKVYVFLKNVSEIIFHQVHTFFVHQNSQIHVGEYLLRRLMDGGMDNHSESYASKTLQGI